MNPHGSPFWKKFPFKWQGKIHKSWDIISQFSDSFYREENWGLQRVNDSFWERRYLRTASSKMTFSGTRHKKLNARMWRLPFSRSSGHMRTCVPLPLNTRLSLPSEKGRVYGFQLLNSSEPQVQSSPYCCWENSTFRLTRKNQHVRWSIWKSMFTQ